MFWAKVAATVLVLTSLSRIFAVLWTPDGQVWTGRVYFAPADRFVYASYIEQVRDGAFLLEDIYTSKDESTPMFNIFWIGAGLIARLTGLSAKATLELLRLALIPALLFVLYLFLKLLISDIFQRKLTFLLAAFGGGLGVWLYPLLEPFFREKPVYDYLPIDFTVAESFIFTTCYYSAHFIFSMLLFVAILFFSLLVLERRRLSYAIPAGLAGLLLANFHPFSFVVICFILGVYAIYLFWKDRRGAGFFLKYLFIFALLSFPSAAYHYYMLDTPWWRNQIWNSGTERPNIIFIAVGYGLLLVFSVLEVIVIVKNKIKFDYAPILVIWFLSQVALIFFPMSVQRRFLEGYGIILSILAGYFLKDFLKKRKWMPDRKIFALIFFTLSFSLSFIAVLYFDFYNIYLRIKSMYISSDAIEAMMELKRVAGPDELVLADIFNANMIPGLAVRRVFV